MKRRSLLCLLSFLLAFSLLLAACTPASDHDSELNENQNTSSGDVEYPAYDTSGVYPDVTGQLVIDVTDENRNPIVSAMNIYQQMFPNVEVVTNNYVTEEETSAYYKNLAADIMAGKASDLILFRSNTFPDIYKSMEAGVFEDLNPYFENDDSIHLENYHSAILEGGVYKGSRFFVPIGYTVDAFLTTREALEDKGVELSDTPTFKEFIGALGTYITETKNHTDEYVLSIKDLNYNFWPWSNLEIVDYVDKTVNVEMEEFKLLMDFMRDLYSYFEQRSRLTNVDVDLIKSGTLLLKNNSTVHPTVFLNEYLRLLEDSTPVCFTMPGVNGQTGAEAYYGAVIPKASANKENAYEFLKILMSEDVQGIPVLGISLPVNNQAREEIINYWIDAHIEYIKEEDGVDISEKVTLEIRQFLVDMYSDVTYAANDSNAILDFIYETMTPYFNGESEYDECLAQLKNKLELYVLE